jgi:hypothetical protein
MQNFMHGNPQNHAWMKSEIQVFPNKQKQALNFEVVKLKTCKILNDGIFSSVET